MRPAEFAHRAVRHVAWRVERATTLTADRLRRGDRVVIMTPPAGLRYGNWLYLWLDAHSRTSAGLETFVLEAPGMEPWLDAFPTLRTLTTAREDLRFHDRREWSEQSWNQRFGDEFTRDELNAFIADVLAPHISPDPSDRLVINVRRGDYYSNEGFRQRYGFDQVGYLRAAMARVGPASGVLVVSDDMAWCRENLDAAIRESYAQVDYAEPGAVSNFLAVAATRRLIGTNSTFSYWGGYIAGVLHEEPLIVMPRFHARMAGSWDAHQLDPEWTIIDGFC